MFCAKSVKNMFCSSCCHGISQGHSCLSKLQNVMWAVLLWLDKRMCAIKVMESKKKFRGRELNPQAVGASFSAHSSTLLALVTTTHFLGVMYLK